MIELKVKLTCDNDKCPDEATADALIELRLDGTPFKLLQGLQLPPAGQWVRHGAKVFCTHSCKQMAEYP